MVKSMVMLFNWVVHLFVDTGDHDPSSHVAVIFVTENVNEEMVMDMHMIDE